MTARQTALDALYRLEADGILTIVEVDPPTSHCGPCAGSGWLRRPAALGGGVERCPTCAGRGVRR